MCDKVCARQLLLGFEVPSTYEFAPRARRRKKGTLHSECITGVVLHFSNAVFQLPIKTEQTLYEGDAFNLNMDAAVMVDGVTQDFEPMVLVRKRQLDEIYRVKREVRGAS